MKQKLVAILVTASMGATLLAGCGNSDSADTAEATETEETSEEAATEVVAEPEEEPTEEAIEANESKTEGETFVNSDGEPLKFAYLARSMQSQWCVDVGTAYDMLAEDDGFVVLTADADMSAEEQFTQIDEMITEGVDAIFISIYDEGTAPTIAERIQDAGILCIGESIAMTDEDGNYVAPCVMLDAYQCGYDGATWIGENYQSILGDDVDVSKIGFFCAADSRLQNDMLRVDGANQGILDSIEGFSEDNIFLCDVAADASSDDMEAAYNQTGALIAAHPEIEYWFSVPVLDYRSVGVCSAFEDNDLTDKAIICSLGGENAIPAWQEGQEAPWYACVYFGAMDCCDLIVDAAYQVLVEGVDPTEVFTPEGDSKYGYETFNGVCVTYDNYEDYYLPLG